VKKKVIFGLVVGMFICSIPIQALASIIYDEMVDGDAPSPIGSINLGVLGLGSNVVQGWLPGNDDFDGFSFTVASNYQVDSLTLLDFIGPGGSFDFSPGKGTSVIPAIFDSNIGDNLLDLVLVSSPLNVGTYDFQVRTGNNFNEFYAIDIEVAPVPEPATMLLLGTGLVGVAGAARRKKKNQA
jgi:hypothetical protein